MSVIQIRKAERQGARVVIGLAGISGSGKTYTALQLAWGLAKGDANKVGFLDTENKRGSLYADTLKGRDGAVHQFWIGDLDAPFSPDRYIQAIQQFQDAGVEVLVIDSVSHEWEGRGGCEDIAHAPDQYGKAPKNPRWNEAKREHKRFMDAMLQCDMHVIVCIRAREKVKQERIDNKLQYIPLGIMPICEKNFMFEMTASLMMWNEGRMQEVMKCPAALTEILGRGNDYLGASDGMALRKWIDGAKPVNQEAERARNALRMVTENGMAALIDAWKALPEATRLAISADGKCPADLKASAQAFDDAATAATNGDQAIADLNSQIMGDGNVQ